jgi:hypothetical protein
MDNTFINALRAADARERRMTYTVRYRGFLSDVTRSFDTHARAVEWCRQVGRPELIDTITSEEK